MPLAQGLSFSLYLLGRAVLLGARQWAFSASSRFFLSFRHGLREVRYDQRKLEGRIPLVWTT
jgi:hypothetical protein